MHRCRLTPLFILRSRIPGDVGRKSTACSTLVHGFTNFLIRPTFFSLRRKRPLKHAGLRIASMLVSPQYWQKFCDHAYKGRPRFYCTLSLYSRNHVPFKLREKKHAQKLHLGITKISRWKIWIVSPKNYPGGLIYNGTSIEQTYVKQSPQNNHLDSLALKNLEPNMHGLNLAITESSP